jgi:single-stranded-DNA-specific exonuclease
VVVVGLDADGMGRGSCRSIENFDILKHLEACAPLLLKYGGHAMAAGLEVEGKNIEAFRRRFNEVAAESLSSADLRAILPVDAWIRLSEADENFLKHQSRMKPFGHANPMPVWAVRGVRVVGEPRVVGTRHVRMTLMADGVKRDAIAFNTALEAVPKGPMDVAFHLQENHYLGQSSLQLNVQGLRVVR